MQQGLQFTGLEYYRYILLLPNIAPDLIAPTLKNKTLWVNT